MVLAVFRALRPLLLGADACLVVFLRSGASGCHDMHHAPLRVISGPSKQAAPWLVCHLRCVFESNRETHPSLPPPTQPPCWPVMWDV